MVLVWLLTTSVNVAQFVGSWALWLTARALTALQFVKLVMRVAPFLYLDIVDCLMRRFNRIGPVRSRRWFIVAIGVWQCIMVTQVPLWYWLLSKYPMVLVLSVVDIVIVFRCYAQRWLISLERRCTFPTSRISRALTNDVEELMDLLLDHVMGLGLDGVSLVSAWAQLVEVQGWVPYAITVKLLSHVTCAMREILQKLGYLPPERYWTLSELPRHTTNPGYPCPVHDVCGICLENMCIIVDNTSSSATDAAWEPAASANAEATILGDASGELKRRGRCCDDRKLRAPHPDASSGGRAVGLEEEDAIARLICGHTFHGQCIAEASKLRPFCPYCRACLDNGLQPERMEDVEEQLELLSVGSVCMVASLASTALVVWCVEQFNQAPTA